MLVAALLLATDVPDVLHPGSPLIWRRLAGRPIVRHAAHALLAHVDLVQPVGDTGRLADALGVTDKLRPAVPGADTRQRSVRLGLEALDRLPPEQRPGRVLVHDANRPCVPDYLVRDVVAALATQHAVVPCLPLRGTIRRLEGTRCGPVVPVSGLAQIQTPQGFDFATLLEAHRAGSGFENACDIDLLERAGIAIGMIEGAAENIEAAEEVDLMRLERTLVSAMQARTGSGFDVHAFGESRPLVLCGVAIPHSLGLAGHSDADVGLHALCDALYGALAEGDIGQHFPPSEASWKDADSARFLTHAAQRISARGGSLVNADLTLICEQPKIGPHANAMRSRLAELLGVEIGRISVKATTTERLGFTGRGEGIACQATATILLP